MNYKLMHNDGGMARNLPIRIYLPENCPVIQEPASPIDDKGTVHTVLIAWNELIGRF
jgi:autophagy-related protein 5